MKYTKFTIENYKGISGPLGVDLHKTSLMPIIGVNECGKTTILQAIFSFDYFNDSFNETIRHLEDVHNLYTTDQKTPKISAKIEITDNEIKETLKELKEKDPSLDSKVRSYTRLLKDFSGTLIISRDIKEKRYNIDYKKFSDTEFNDTLSEAIIKKLPYILFFDDFRDNIEEKIEIKKSDDEMSGWLAIVDRLFRTADENFDILDLPNKEDRIRKTTLAKVNKILNDTLTKEWQNFRLDDKDALKIKVDYEKESETTAAGQAIERHFIKFDVIEKDQDDNEYFFFVRDRSKGFFWFFNFVMKLEFNPKVVNSTDGAIYLLDEPGSYLHASAQAKLCKKLKSLSETNKVLYCTHSHYLLDPEVVPINTVKVASKNPDNFKIELYSIHEYKDDTKSKRSAFQPITDALQIKPLILDLNYKNILITEGIYDYYAFEMFKGKREINVLPSTNAESIKYFISLMIAWQINYKALWDNDDEGRTEKKSAEEFFGEVEANNNFYLLPHKTSRTKKTILQNLFVGNDFITIKGELGLNKNSSFEKTILSLFYSKDKNKILKKVSKETKNNFKKVFDLLFKK